MIVYPLPPQLLTSPYLDQLYAPMAALGVQVHRGRPRTELPRLLAGHGPRILHLHFFDELTQRPTRTATAARTLGLLALLDTLRARGVRVVWTAHNIQPHETLHPRLADACYRGVLRRCTAVIAHSHAALHELSARYGPPQRSAVIPHGSYIGLYGPHQDRNSSRHALNLPISGRVTLCIGTLRRYKGIEALIAAFSAQPQARRGTLLIAGAPKDAAYAAEITALAATMPGVRVRTEFVPDAVLPQYLAAADLVALPYHTLLTSGVLLWALSYARPVLAPNLGPVRELIIDSVNGFLFPPGEPAALAAALGRALAHPNLDALGRRGFGIANAFGWDGIAVRTVAVYRAANAGR